MPWEPEGGVRPFTGQEMLLTTEPPLQSPECGFYSLLLYLFLTHSTDGSMGSVCHGISVSKCEAHPSSKCHCGFDQSKINASVLTGVIQ